MKTTKFVLLLLGLLGGIFVYETAALSDSDIIAKAEALLSTPESRLQQEADMRDYVEFASVAAESKFDKDTRDCAEWIRMWLSERLNMEDAALYESGYRHPIVVASSSNDMTKPAVVIYGTFHYYMYHKILNILYYCSLPNVSHLATLILVNIEEMTCFTFLLSFCI